MLDEILCTTNEPPDNYVRLTYAYDLLNGERFQLLRECRRLEKKGSNVLVKWWDTRKDGRLVERGDDVVTVKPGVWGEIWVEQGERQ